MSRLFPHDAVVGILPNDDRVGAAVSALTSKGFAESDISILAGRDGIETIDPEGKNHGLLGRIFRKIDTLGDEHDETVAHVQALREGKLVLSVHVENDEEKQRAVAAFRENDGNHVSYYSRWTSEQLIP